MSDTPLTDKATYWHTAEGGDVVNPADMEALERQMNAVTAELARVTAQRDAALKDAELWRRCILDGDFPARHKGAYMYVCRTTGKINIGDAGEVVDAAIDAEIAAREG